MALPADGRMDLADLVIVGNAISRLAVPALKEAAIGLGLVYSETCPSDTNVIKFRKSGFLIAEALAEGAVYTPSDANSDINDTSVTATAAKVVVGSPISVEAIRFGAGGADTTRISAEQGRAIARKFDDDLLALFDSITLTAVASSTMSVDTLLEGQYKVLNGNVPPGPLTAILDYKQVYELKKIVASSGAAQYANSTQIAMLNSTPSANNFVGNFLGVDIYQTTGLSTTGGDMQGAIFNPQYAFCAALGGAIESNVYWTGNGVASQVPGFSYVVNSHIFYDVKLWTDAAACEIRSDS